jgi:hypothetical protein
VRPGEFLRRDALFCAHSAQVLGVPNDSTKMLDDLRSLATRVQALAQSEEHDADPEEVARLCDVVRHLVDWLSASKLGQRGQRG